MDLLIGTLISIFSSLVTVPVVFGIQIGYRRVRTRGGVGAFWRQTLRHPLLSVTPKLDLDPIHTGTQSLDFLGLSELLIELAKKFGVSNINAPARSDQVGQKQLEMNNLLIVGGPVANDEAKLYFGESSTLPVRFDDPLAVPPSYDVLVGSTIRLIPERRPDGSVAKDYGIVTRIPNKFNDKLVAVVACGCWGWGTRGALKAMCDEQITRRINDLLASGDDHRQYFQVVIEVFVDDSGRESTPKIVDGTFRKLP